MIRLGPKGVSAKEYAERPTATLEEARRLFGDGRAYAYIAERLAGGGE